MLASSVVLGPRLRGTEQRALSPFGETRRKAGEERCWWRGLRAGFEALPRLVAQDGRDRFAVGSGDSRWRSLARCTLSWGLGEGGAKFQGWSPGGVVGTGGGRGTLRSPKRAASGCGHHRSRAVARQEHVVSGEQPTSSRLRSGH